MQMGMENFSVLASGVILSVMSISFINSSLLQELLCRMIIRITHLNEKLHKFSMEYLACANSRHATRFTVGGDGVIYGNW